MDQAKGSRWKGKTGQRSRNYHRKDRKRILGRSCDRLVANGRRDVARCESARMRQGERGKDTRREVERERRKERQANPILQKKAASFFSVPP